MRDRRVGTQHSVQVLYGSAHSSAVLRVTLQNARPRGRPPLSDCKQSLAGQRGIALRVTRVSPGKKASNDGDLRLIPL